MTPHRPARGAQSGSPRRACPSHICFCIVLVALASGFASPLMAGGAEFEVREGLNLNRFLREADVAAHLVLRSGAQPRILIAFPAGNSGVGLWFERLPAAAHWSLVSNPRPMRIDDARGRN